VAHIIKNNDAVASRAPRSVRDALLSSDIPEMGWVVCYGAQLVGIFERIDATAAEAARNFLHKPYR
jgi:hypothetical protein